MIDFIQEFESEVRGYVRQFPTVFASASNAHVVDGRGRTYIDFFAGAGALNYGHNNPRAKEALIQYLHADGLMHSLDMATEAKVRFIQQFQQVILAPRGLDYKLQFTGPTGTNAVEAAIKLARKSKQRSHIVAFTNAYHGHSLGSLALTGNRFYHSEFYGSHNNVTHLPYDGYMDGWDSAALLRKMLDDTGSGLPLPAAIVLETIQCEGGIRVASLEWLCEIERICHEKDILLIVDDIQVGNGRTGSFFSFEQMGFQPDIVCLSKSIGGGLPMSLVLMAPHLDAWQPGEHTGTFRGNNLAFVASAALLEYWRDDRLQNRVMEFESVVREHLACCVASYGNENWDVRGRGMVWGLDVGCGELASRICRTAFERQLIVESCGPRGEVIKLLPALTIERSTLESGLSILADSIAASGDRRSPVAAPGGLRTNTVIPSVNTY